MPYGQLGLLEEDAPGSPLTNMLQGLNLFLLDKITHDWKTIHPHSHAFDQVTQNPLSPYALLLILMKVLSTPATTSIRCTNCRSEHTRPASIYVNELVYPLPVRTVKYSRQTPLIVSEINSSECKVTQTNVY